MLKEKAYKTNYFSMRKNIIKGESRRKNTEMRIAIEFSWDY